MQLVRLLAGLVVNTEIVPISNRMLVVFAAAALVLMATVASITIMFAFAGLHIVWWAQ